MQEQHQNVREICPQVLAVQTNIANQQLPIPVNKSPRHSHLGHININTKSIRDELNNQILVNYDKNKKKYLQIVSQIPAFGYQLHIPISNGRSSQNFIEQQLQKVIADAEILDKHINKIEFQREQKKQMIESISSSNIFEFLRTSWAKHIVAENSSDKLQQINRKIGSIKGQIKKVVDNQNELDQNSSFEEIVKNSRYFLTLSSKHDQLQQNMNKNQAILRLQKDQISKLAKQNNKLKWDLHLQKEKTVQYFGQISTLKSNLSTKNKNSTKQDICSLEQLIEEQAILQGSQTNIQNVNNKKMNQIIYWHKSNKFSVKIESQILSTSQNIETKKTLHDIQKFLSPVADMVSSVNIDELLESRRWSGINEKMGAFVHRQQRQQRLKNMPRRNKMEAQLQRSEIDESKQNKDDAKTTLEDAMSVEGRRKRFFRSPKTDKVHNPMC